VAPAGRLLDLLALLGSRPWWTGADLVERLEVTDRTLRRDVTRLRELGYPVEAVSGPYGGYRLGRGGRLPPLVLDDDEAVAVAVALRQVAAASGSGLEGMALTALTKLDQVLPPLLRERVAAVQTMTVPLRVPQVPPVDLDRLVLIAVACRRPERLRFTYTAGSGDVTERHVEPFRLVNTERQWYLVAFDLDRADWRTFRVDRASEVNVTGARFERADEPDAAGIVADGIAVGGWEHPARVRLHLDLAEATRRVDATTARLEPETAGTTIAVIGGDVGWVARELVALGCRIDVLESQPLVDELHALGRLLLDLCLVPPDAADDDRLNRRPTA
jgi:predicted DNA-binding transcriptional regulator YafY